MKPDYSTGRESFSLKTCFCTKDVTAPTPLILELIDLLSNLKVTILSMIFKEYDIFLNLHIYYSFKILISKKTSKNQQTLLLP